MLLHMLLFGAYAIYYAMILGSNMLSRGDCATAVLLYGRFRLIYYLVWYGLWWRHRIFYLYNFFAVSVVLLNTSMHA